MTAGDLPEKSRPSVGLDFQSAEWIEGPTGFIRLRQDGILETRAKTGAVETLKTAKDNFNLGIQIVGNKAPVPMLLVLGGLTDQSREARNFWADNAGRLNVISRLAIVTRSYVSLVLGNVFIGLSKPDIPVKLFTDENKAISWLKKSSLTN
ncbi:MAG: hypothetical protein GY848_06130 [Methyloversatilis sp.]|nr:hypothetical protein [Methyloversatilis sp.]